MKGLTKEQIRALYTKPTICTNCGLQRPHMRRDGLCTSCYRASRLVNTSPPDYSTESRHSMKARRAANGAVSRAVKSGKLIKPAICASCSLQKPLHAHHEDYNRPLDVVWLCIRCHRQRHKRE